MNRREAFAVAFGAACAAMFPPAGGVEDEIFRMFGVQPPQRPLETPHSFFLAEEARFCREVVEPMQRRLLAAMAEKLDRDWLGLT
jgi:hypothetical protein